MRDPDCDGPYGKAWLLKSDLPDKRAGIASWLVNRPGAHPFWQWWLVAIVHLRDLPGVTPAHKKYPEAEYEFMIFSIDPERCPNPEPDDPKGYPSLTPFDVVEQYHGITDQDSERLCKEAVRMIVEQGMSPDQDFRSLWASVIAGTVQHFAEGRHPTN